MATLREWLESIGLEACAEAFEHQAIAMADLADLTEDDLREIGLSVGHRKRFLAARAEHFGAAFTTPSRPREATAERRHITVMFCDLIGSTSLSDRLEAEDLLNVLRRYRTLCQDAVERYDGVLVRLVGDGVDAFFGHPTAHENDAERAIRAALEIIANIGSIELQPAMPIKVRIGIATGFVLVGDLFDAGGNAQNEIVGSVPNLAARLQAFAPENAVVVAPATWRLVRKIFTAEGLGGLSVRGFDRPVQAWMILGERQDSDHAAGVRPLIPLTSFIDREEELCIIKNSWARACAGRGQALLITGEAGIGKSRLLAQFLSGLAPAPSILRHFCSPFMSSSPLGPTASHFSTQAGIERNDSPETKLEKLATLVSGADPEREDSLAGLAWLFSLPYQGAGATMLAPRPRRARALRGLAGLYVGRAGDSAVISIIEDLQWADPTKVDLIELLLAGLAERRVLLVLTSRESTDAAWQKRPELTHIEIGRLPREKSIEIVRQLAGARALRPPVVQEIILKTDGIPLFIEEFTQSIVESLDAPAEGGTPNGSPHVPATLHESLLARLDRAGPGKELAQICAVIGRTASTELVGAVATLEPFEFERAREILVRSGILFLETGRDGQQQYVFKHSLVRDTAYASLLRDRRRELHARVAAAQPRILPEVVDQQPEVLAHHLTEAGRIEDALNYWLRAGRRGLQRSANLEATAHLQRGLQLLDSLPASEECKKLRLEFLTLLAPALISVMGPGTAEVERLFAEAIDICRSLPESSEHFPVYWGWWRVSRDFRIMRERADDLLKRAQARGDEALLLQAHHCQWASHFNAGDFTSSAEHIESGLRIYETGDYRAHASLYGNHDAKVCAHGERALIFWLTGDPDRALDEEHRSLAWADTIGHAGSRSHAMDYALIHRVYRRDAKRVLALADDIIRFAEDQGFSDPEAKGLIFRGWAKTVLGDASGLAEAEVGLLRQRDIGTTEDFPVYYSMLAEAHMLAGEIDRAIEIVFQAKRESDNSGLEIWLPELSRWLGVLGRRVGQNDSTIENHFVGALDVARRQHANMLELRVALDLAALRRERGDILDAVELIETPLKRMVGGHDTEEWARAMQFLSEVGVAAGH
jgi:predicted ATPase/class 3 adenylate cyclase